MTRTMLAMLLLGTLAANSADALTLAIRPVDQDVVQGQQVHVDVIATDLNAEIISTYDFVVTWDPAVLSLASVELDVFLGPGSHQDYDVDAGSVNVAEIAVSDVPPNQNGLGEFRLFSLTFDTIAAGTSALAMRGNMSPTSGFALGRYAQPLVTNPTTASITVIGDQDADGVPDPSDNCTLVANPDQRDTNGDGFGNLCDPDLDNDGIVNFSDLSMLEAVFYTNDPDADFDGSGSVNFFDLGVMKRLFFLPPGPSGLAQ